MNDLIYNEIIATPGYELDFAVGTTYSLDAEAFMALALSFAHLGEISESDFQHPMRLLEGVRQANNKVALFCNRGGLKPPTRSNPLFAMLDKSVFEVADERKGKELANFHPKVWIIKEHCIDDANLRQIKVIVMSRNLTKDTSLDIAVTMTAKLGQRNSAALRRKHEPLKLLLQTLAEYASTTKRKEIRRLANDIDTLGEFDVDAPFEDYEFFPIHFGNYLNQQIDIQASLKGSKVIVVSPFIDADTLSWINKRSDTYGRVLITRLDSLTPEIMELYKGENREVWAASSVMAQNDIQAMDLHAKMYFVENPKDIGGCHLWLGSANATTSGFYRNSEFLLHLKYKRSQLLFDKFKDEFCNEDRQQFQKIEKLPESEATVSDQSLAREIRKWFISRNNLLASAIEESGETKVIINAKKIRDFSGEILFAPIQEPNNVVSFDFNTQTCCLKVTDKSHLSEFYILTANPSEDSHSEPLKMVIKIPTTGIPENRDSLIFQSFVNTQDKFLKYVEMMISENPYEISTLLQAHENGDNSNNAQSTYQTASLYESMLKIAATEPKRLLDIDDVVSRANVSVIPGSFQQMYNQFKQIIKKLK